MCVSGAALFFRPRFSIGWCLHRGSLTRIKVTNLSTKRQGITHDQLSHTWRRWRSGHGLRNCAIDQCLLPWFLSTTKDANLWHKFCTGYRYPHSEKPHVFPEAAYDVAVRNTCGFSAFTLAEAGDYLRRRAFGALWVADLEYLYRINSEWFDDRALCPNSFL